MSRYTIFLGLLLGLFSPFNAFVSYASDDVFQEMKYIVEGESMVPFGYLPGHIVASQYVKASVGDVIVFSCTLPGCNGYYIKELTQKKEGCYWIEGRHDIWQGSNGQEKFSRDSRTEFGWMCDEDIRFLGIAHNIT